MKRIAALLALYATLVAPAAAKKKLVGPETGMVVSQQEGSTPAGWGAALIGRGVIAGPRFHNWSLVTIDAGPYRYQWQETKYNGRLVFIQREQVQFWRYGNLFLVVDREGKTHKFGAVTAIKR